MVKNRALASFLPIDASIPRWKGVMKNGDEEGPGKEGEENHQKEITRDPLWIAKSMSLSKLKPYHEDGLRGFVF
jgi:hypothetical protein